MRAQPADRSWVSSRDLRFAVRSLTGGPGFSLGVIGSLVLGIVANITAFSFVNAAVFRPFPGVRNQHELVAVGVARAERFGSVISSSYEQYQTLRASLPALDDLAAQLRVQLVVTHRGESSAVNAALVSAGWFDVLGVRPAAGRFFLAHVPARLLHIRFDQSGQFTLPALQKAVRDVDYRVPIRDATTLRERRDRTDQERRLLANGVVALGIFALTLAAGGLYGVVSYLVAIRRRELGIRLALGASPSSVAALVVRQALLPAAIGAVIGAAGAIAIGLVVRSRLYGASAVDPMAFAADASLLLATVATATLIPARYAASIDPAAILREE